MVKILGPLHRGTLVAALVAFLPVALHAQPGTGVVWADFGPWNSNGSFFEITKVRDGSISAYGVAVDPENRVLTLAEWQDATVDFNLDCSVTRHLPNARNLDMDFTGELEASRRIALDLGGGDDDHCTAIDVDPVSRPVIVGYANTAGPDSAFVIRLAAADGDHDPAFSSDGQLVLANILAFAGHETRFQDVETYADRRILACGSIERDGEQNMLVVRFNFNGSLDTTFNGTGYREIDFDGAGAADDACDRLLILPDQRIVLAGTGIGGFNSVLGYALVRLLANGNFDPGFSTNGVAFVDDGSTVTQPAVVDLGYDAGRQRLVVAANATGGVATPGGALVAVTDGGSLDTTFSGTGRRNLRFSEIGLFAGERGFGATWLKRLLMRSDGSFYVAGTHENSSADAAEFGATDVALARVRADGEDDDASGSGFGGGGVAFYAYSGMGHSDVKPAAERLRIGDTLEDAIFYRGNVLLLSETNRYPEGIWSDEAWNLGPIAPVLAGIVTDRIWNQDFEFDGLAQPTSPFPVISVPAGYGRYCSVRDPIAGTYGLLPQGAGSDPCQQFLDDNPNAVIERAGLYSLSGKNNVLATCNGGYIGLQVGNGTTPFDLAFAATAGRTDCIFTASPAALPVFDRPYTGGHPSDPSQSFNHDVYNLPLDVSDFGQTPNGAHPLAHWIDLNGVQECNGSDADGNGLDDPFHGIDEPASDIQVQNDRIVLAVAAGRVESAVPRYVLRYTPVGNDPHQREVFVRHSIGGGRYGELFTTYYAHMSDTRVRRGDAISAGTELGRVGTTGASSDYHLHISVLRHKNLSWRATFEHGYANVDFDQGKEVGAIDPWGWRAPQGVDPWAWRFRFNAEPHPDNAGAWSINLWKPGEDPPVN